MQLTLPFWRDRDAAFQLIRQFVCYTAIRVSEGAAAFDLLTTIQPHRNRLIRRSDLIRDLPDDFFFQGFTARLPVLGSNLETALLHDLYLYNEAALDARLPGYPPLCDPRRVALGGKCADRCSLTQSLTNAASDSDHCRTAFEAQQQESRCARRGSGCSDGSVVVID